MLRERHVAKSTSGRRGGLQAKISQFWRRRALPLGATGTSVTGSVLDSATTGGEEKNGNEHEHKDGDM